MYLTVCRKRTTHQLRKLEPVYISICYGVTLIPALVFLLLRPEKGQIYGDATLWCWISTGMDAAFRDDNTNTNSCADWHILRVASFYGPVWVVLFSTFFIYLFCGRIIFNLRRKLRVFARANHLHHIQPHEFPEPRLTISSPSSAAQSAARSAAPSPPPAETKCILMPLDKIVVRKTVNTEVVRSQTPPDSGHSARHSIGTPAQEASYICTITTANCDRDRPISRNTARSVRSIQNPRHQRTAEANTAALAYARCSLLFFLALFITCMFSRQQRRYLIFPPVLMKLGLPSSINRVYQLQHPDRQSFPMLFAAALVLPLQGFWNGLIYIVTTLPAVENYLRDIAQFFSEVSDSMAAKIVRHRTKQQQQHQYHEQFQSPTSHPGSIMVSNPSRDSLPFYQPITIAQR